MHTNDLNVQFHMHSISLSLFKADIGTEKDWENSVSHCQGALLLMFLSSVHWEMK